MGMNHANKYNGYICLQWFRCKGYKRFQIKLFNGDQLKCII